VIRFAAAGLLVADAILALAPLSYFGFGLAPPAPTRGGMQPAGPTSGPPQNRERW
jgi:ABC-type dipeptide/oligopeptide/nickel transport system permease subunit